jgi:hypothetical protein
MTNTLTRVHNGYPTSPNNKQKRRAESQERSGESDPAPDPLPAGRARYPTPQTFRAKAAAARTDGRTGARRGPTTRRSPAAPSSLGTYESGARAGSDTDGVPNPQVCGWVGS